MDSDSWNTVLGLHTKRTSIQRTEGQLELPINVVKCMIAIKLIISLNRVDHKNTGQDFWPCLTNEIESVTIKQFEVQKITPEVLPRNSMPHTLSTTG